MGVVSLGQPLARPRASGQLVPLDHIHLVGHLGERGRGKHAGQTGTDDDGSAPTVRGTGPGRRREGGLSAREASWRTAWTTGEWAKARDMPARAVELTASVGEEGPVSGDGRIWPLPSNAQATMAA